MAFRAMDLEIIETVTYLAAKLELLPRTPPPLPPHVSLCSMRVICVSCELRHEEYEYENVPRHVQRWFAAIWGLAHVAN